MPSTNWPSWGWPGHHADGFRSLALPIVLMIPIEMAVFINMTVPYLMGEHHVYGLYDRLLPAVGGYYRLFHCDDLSLPGTSASSMARLKPSKGLGSQHASHPDLRASSGGGRFGLTLFVSVSAIADLGHLVSRGALLSMLMVFALLPNLFVGADRMIIFGDSRGAAHREAIQAPQA